MFICKHCGKECKNKNSLVQHEIRCKLNPNKLNLEYLENVRLKIKREKGKGKNQYTKGTAKPLSKETRYKIGNAWRGKQLSDEMKKHISEGMQKAIKNNPTSYSSQNVNGRVKKYQYNNIELDGLWEVEVAKYLDSLNIKWNKPNKGFNYEWNNSNHVYFPDFYLIDYNLYIEVKGYIRERDYKKWNAIPNLIIIKQKEIKEIRNKTYNIFDIIKSI